LTTSYGHFSNARTRGPSIQDHDGAQHFAGLVKIGVVEVAGGYASQTCRCGTASRSQRENKQMIVLGVILILVGYLLPVPAIIASIGWVLLVIGVVLLVLGQVGRPVGGRRYWY
jgi:hypothetical protein